MSPWVSGSSDMQESLVEAYSYLLGLAMHHPNSRTEVVEALQLARYLATASWDDVTDEPIEIPLLFVLEDVQRDEVTSKTLIDLRIAIEIAKMLDAERRCSGHLLPLLRAILATLSKPSLIAAARESEKVLRQSKMRMNEARPAPQSPAVRRQFRVVK